MNQTMPKTVSFCTKAYDHLSRSYSYTQTDLSAHKKENNLLTKTKSTKTPNQPEEVLTHKTPNYPEEDTQNKLTRRR